MINDHSKKYDPSVCSELDHANWNDILPRVLKYAVARARKYYFLVGNQVEAMELVNEAIARAYGGGKGGTYRNWNKGKYPNLVDFLISIIKSMTSHEVEHLEKFKQEDLFHDNGSPKDFQLSPDSKEMATAFNPKSPEQKFLESERLDLLEKELRGIQDEDEELGLVILCLEQGISRPMYIAEETGLGRDKVNNALKSLRKKLKKILLRLKTLIL